MANKVLSNKVLLGMKVRLFVYNDTDYDMVRTHTHKYQMNQWDTPMKIGGQEGKEILMNFSTNIFKVIANDGADVVYDTDLGRIYIHVHMNKQCNNPYVICSFSGEGLGISPRGKQPLDGYTRVFINPKMKRRKP